jgi:hypothetical protein
LKWVGPYRIDELLDQFHKPQPPESNAVYVVSKKRWHGEPTETCVPLYVGSNTGRSRRFRTRIGDLIADVFGFYVDAGTKNKTGHHSGGKTLHKYCVASNLNPKRLYIGWAEECDCARCAENTIYDQLKPAGTLKNNNRPSRCKKHVLI